jgi:hypothetical protein
MEMEDRIVWRRQGAKEIDRSRGENTKLHIHLYVRQPLHKCHTAYLEQVLGFGMRQKVTSGSSGAHG